MARRKNYTANSMILSIESEPAFIPLDRMRITETALALLNEVGYKELTMRRVADALDVKAASLYYHVKDKDELMELLVERISKEIDWPDAGLPWKAQLLGWSDSFRAVLQQYRDAADLFHAAVGTGYNRLLHVERLFATLAAAGFRDEEISWIAAIVKNYIVGYVSEEVRLSQQAKRYGEGMEPFEEKMQQAFSSLPQDTFPHVIRLAPLTTNSDWDAEFRFGLEIILEGLSVRLHQQGGDRS